MVVKLSSHGQMIIPKQIREQLMLQPGSALDVSVVDQSIVIRPVTDEKGVVQAISSLYGMFATDLHLLDMLEAEHLEELDKEQQ